MISVNLTTIFLGDVEEVTMFLYFSENLIEWFFAINECFSLILQIQRYSRGTNSSYYFLPFWPQDHHSASGQKNQ